MSSLLLSSPVLFKLGVVLVFLVVMNCVVRRILWHRWKFTPPRESVKFRATPPTWQGPENIRQVWIRYGHELGTNLEKIAAMTEDEKIVLAHDTLALLAGKMGRTAHEIRADPVFNLFVQCYFFFLFRLWITAESTKEWQYLIDLMPVTPPRRTAAA